MPLWFTINSWISHLKTGLNQCFSSSNQSSYSNLNIFFYSPQYGIEKRADPDDEDEDEDEDDDEFGGSSSKKEAEPEDPVAREYSAVRVAVDITVIY